METDRPVLEDEIEVTPEMLEAGVKVFVSYDSRFESPVDCVEEIYEAMSKIMAGRRFRFHAQSIVKDGHGSTITA